MGDNDTIVCKMELVEMERAGDSDASRAVVVPTTATADYGLSDAVEGVVTSRPRSTAGKKLRIETHEEAKVGVLTAVRFMLGTPHKATFFAAVGLSGMGAGVIDMFLFIR